MFRRIILNFSLVLASLSVGLLASEIVVRRAFFTDAERRAGAAKQFSVFHNDYVRRAVTEYSMKEDEDCLWTDSLVAHPYLGWVSRGTGKCAQANLNSRNLPGRDIGLEKDDSHFNILIVGGSVAAQFAGGDLHGRVWLEEILNRDYISPNGKPFAVLQAAFGSWRMPAQNIALTLFGNRADAVLAIDGFNESIGPLMDMPNVGLAMRLSRDGEEERHWINFRSVIFWRELCRRTPVLRRSFLAVSIYRWMNVQVATQLETALQDSPYSSYRFPDTYSEGQKEAWNKAQFQHYLRLLAGQAKTLNLKFAHFLQPIPGFLKPLTDYEKKHADHVSEDKYIKLIAANAELAREGIRTFSLAGIFKDHPEEIYSDFIHCKFDENGDSPGYRLMAEAIVPILAKEWRLRRK